MLFNCRASQQKSSRRVSCHSWWAFPGIVEMRKCRRGHPEPPCYPIVALPSKSRQGEFRAIFGGLSRVSWKCGNVGVAAINRHAIQLSRFPAKVVKASFGPFLGCRNYCGRAGCEAIALPRGSQVDPPDAAGRQNNFGPVFCVFCRHVDFHRCRGPSRT